MSETIKLKIADKVVELFASDVKFTDTTLNPFFERISGRIDYVGRALASANRIVNLLNFQIEQAFSKAYNIQKTKGEKITEKFAESTSKCDPIYVALCQDLIEAKFVKDQLQFHLNALNAAREDAHNRGHMLRKEMDKLSSDIYSSIPDPHIPAFRTHETPQISDISDAFKG